jgi:hypothetical protein
MSTKIAIPYDEHRERVWHLIAKQGFTPEQAEARVSQRFRVSARKRIKDGWRIQRDKPRITPLEAQRRVQTLMKGCYARRRGANSHKQTHAVRRGARPPDHRTARALVLNKYCVMGTYEDICAWGDAESRRWAKVEF